MDNQKLTAEMLVEHFEKRIQDIDRRTLSVGHGKIPRYPQLVAFLGESAEHGFDVVFSGLSSAWPAFQDEICFLGFERNGDGISYAQLSASNVAIPLDAEGVDAELATLFGENVHFQDMGALFVYYLLETTSFRDAEDLESWLGVIRAVRRQTSLSDIPCNEVLFLFLDESFVHRKVARGIVEWLSVHEEAYADLTLVVLSNYRSDGHILGSWDTCYRIATASMLVSNNTDRAAAGVLTDHDFLTARYIREEKPLYDIGQVVIQGVINAFRASLAEKTQAKLSDVDLAQRLGLTKEGTLLVLDAYVEQSLASQLPNAAELEYYPRVDDVDYGALSGLSAQEFDDVTMGTWSLVLKRLVDDTLESLGTNDGMRRQLRETYGLHLRTTFTPLELINLKNYLYDVKTLLSAPPQSGVREGCVLDSAIWELRLALSSDEYIVAFFAEMIEEQARRADAYFTAFNQLVESLGKLHDIRDESLVSFYATKVRDYFDRRGNDLRQQFWALSGREELYDFLCEVINEVIGSDPVFVAPFEEERECRLGNDAQGVQARTFMRQRLMGEGVPQYLRTSFNLGQPLIAAILMRTGTELHKSLLGMPGDESYYYNTGYNSAAERLELYRVDPRTIGI